MKCTKEWCEFRHLACERFNKNDPMFVCHKPGHRPFQDSKGMTIL